LTPVCQTGPEEQSFRSFFVVRIGGVKEQAMDEQEKGKKGKVLARNRNGDLHLRDVRSDGWSEEERGLFLDMLAATCNVDASAKAAGHKVQSAAGLRRRDAGFRDQWDDALDTGYALLEAMVLEKMQAAMAATRPVAGKSGASMARIVIEDITIKDAMALLDKHRGMVTRIRQGKDGRHAAKTASAKDSYNEIVERLCVLKKRLDSGE
jgi:hypothetical protein